MSCFTEITYTREGGDDKLSPRFPVHRLPYLCISVLVIYYLSMLTNWNDQCLTHHLLCYLLSVAAFQTNLVTETTANVLSEFLWGRCPGWLPGVGLLPARLGCSHPEARLELGTCCQCCPLTGLAGECWLWKEASWAA